MHAECAEFVERTIRLFKPQLPSKPRVLEFGGLFVNGGVRPLLMDSDWYSVDIKDGPGVDEVADASTWHGKGYGEFDIGICLEVFEHTPKWRHILINLIDAVFPAGLIVVTAACDPRPVHGAYGDSTLAPGEYYANVDPVGIESTMTSMCSSFSLSVLDRGDVQAWGIR